MNVLLIIYILFQLICITLIYAENEIPDCNGKDTTIYANPTKIGLTHKGDIVILNDIDITEITGRVNDEFKKLYIDVKYDSGLKRLTVFTTDEFPNYSDEQTKTEMFLTVTYRCPQKTKKWFFNQAFDDITNYFAPTFSQERYEIVVPLPLYKGCDLTMFQQIKATDKDLFGNMIKFSSKDSNDNSIEVGTSSVVGGQTNKTYQAILETLEVFTRIPTNGIEFTITATDRGSTPKSSNAVVVITAKNDISSPPRFEKLLYEGRLDEDFRLANIEFPVVEKPTEVFAIRKFGDDEALFSIDTNVNLIIITLAKPVTEENVRGKAFLKFNLEVSKSGHYETGNTAVVVAVSQNQPAFSFDKSLYEGVIDDNWQLNLETIYFNSDAYSENIQYSLKGHYAGSFAFSYNKYEITVKLSNDFNATPLKGIHDVSFLIEASTSDEKYASAVVYLDLPDSEAQPDDPCPTPDPEPTSSFPKFSKELYKFRAQPNFIGSFGFVAATIPDSNKAAIIYSIYSDNDNLNAGLSIHSETGELYLTSLVSPGVYSFQVTAENADTHSKGHSKGYLEIDTLIQCGSEIQVANALVVKHLGEEHAHEDIINTKLDNCQFKIEGMAPNVRDYFKIDTEKQMLTSMKIDREDDIFLQMIIPQVQVKLRLTCSESHLRRKRDLPTEIFENRSNVLTNDISFTRDTTMLTVIIVDINDNAPEFVFPPKNNTVIGYPEPMISTELLPEYLYRVEATDKDEGLNGTVRYKMDANAYFNIEPETGIIYPFGNNLDVPNDMVLKIYATDRDGAADGLTTSIVLQVKTLSSNHLTLLTFALTYLEYVMDLINKIKAKTGIELVVLKQAIVPYFVSSEVHRWRGMVSKEAGSNVIMKVWTYAFNQNEELIASADIVSQLSQVEQEFGLSAESYEESRITKPLIQKIGSNVTSYIVAVSLLSVFIAGLMGFISWRFYFRRLNYRNLTQTSSGSVTPPTAEMEDNPYSKDSGNVAFRISGITNNDTSDDHSKVPSVPKECATIANAEFEAVEEEQGVPKPKTTVTFNELVERIHIETNDEGKRDAEDVI